MPRLLQDCSSPVDISNRSQPPVWSGPAGNSLDLHGILNGCPVFLIAGGPSFNLINHNTLRQPGCITMGMNNSPATFRPDLWISVDEPAKFLQSIWLDPKIMKFVRSANRDSNLLENDSRIPSRLTPENCPNIVFYRSGLTFDPNSFLTDEQVNWGSRDSDAGRSVMLAALKILYHLGAGHVFLLGVDFRMAEDYTYHFSQRRSRASVQGNMRSYRQLEKDFTRLCPVFEEAGFYVWNCNPDSQLQAFPFCCFDEAVAFASEGLTGSLAAESSEGLYDRVAGSNDSANVLADANPDEPPELRRIARNKRPRIIQAEHLPRKSAEPNLSAGMVLLCDREQEWMLPWWWHHYQCSGTNLPVAVYDAGITEHARAWLKSNGIGVVSGSSDQSSFNKAWFNKPFALAQSPFSATIFSDVDCEVRKDLSALISWSEHGLVLGNDLHPIGPCRKLFREGCYYNSGLIAVRSDNPILCKWCEETRKLHKVFRSDQEILNLAVYESEAKVIELPAHFHQLRLDGFHEEAVVMHWTGDPGKNHIRNNMDKLHIDTLE